MIINSEALALIFGLASAASWGAGDFSGGMATRHNNVYRVVVLSQLMGMLCLATMGLFLAETIPGPDTLFYGGLAGLAGGVGLVALYRGLAEGRMGIVAPVAAVVTALLPVLVGLSVEGLPSAWQLLGFAVAILAVWFLSRGDNEAPLRLHDLRQPGAAGIGFGLFLIFIDRISTEAILWPLVAARAASIVLFFFILITVRHQPGRWPVRSHLFIILLAGLFDTGGNAFFALAARTGRLDVSAVLASLYPAATVFLAWFILKERLNRQQWLGVIAALVALVLIA